MVAGLQLAASALQNPAASLFAPTFSLIPDKLCPPLSRPMSAVEVAAKEQTKLTFEKNKSKNANAPLSYPFSTLSVRGRGQTYKSAFGPEARILLTYPLLFDTTF